MSALYKEIVVGASGAYPTAPNITTYPPAATGAPNYFAAWEPQFHQYRVLGPSGADVFISWDGRSDHARILSAPGAVLPQEFSISAKSTWLRSAAGVTATIGVAYFTRQ